MIIWVCQLMFTISLTLIFLMISYCIGFCDLIKTHYNGYVGLIVYITALTFCCHMISLFFSSMIEYFKNSK